MASGRRVRIGEFSDADVLALYMKYREQRIGPFVREVGDFIAHAKRDRGATLDAISYSFAQFAFFQRYQSATRTMLPFSGKCDWWLKSFFLGKIAATPEKELLANFNNNRRSATELVSNWFGKDPYPREFNVGDSLGLYIQMAQYFSSHIAVAAPFSIHTVEKEIGAIFQRENIPSTVLQDFLIGTATLLAGKTIEIVPGFAARIDLTVSNTRRIKAFAIDATTPLFPDGDLVLMVSTENGTGDGLINLATDFLDTGVDTEGYISHELTVAEHGVTRYDLRRPLSFDTRTVPKIFPID